MAAFERVSNVAIQTANAGHLNLIDLRTATLPDETPPEDGFDPRDYRKPVVPITSYMAYFNLIRCGFGAGILGMPYAISQLGMIFGGVLSILIGVMIIHLYFVLLWCQNEISRQLRIPYVSYRYGFRIAVLHGPTCCRSIADLCPTIVAVIMILSQLGICTVFVIFCADSVRDIMDFQQYTRGLLYLFIPYLLLELCMKDLKYVSYISVIANVTNFFALILVYYHFISEPHGETEMFKFDSFTFFSGTGSLLFNMSSVGVILSLDKSLKDPHIMTSRFGVINLGISVTVILSTITGMVGYWAMGTLEETVVRALPFGDMTAMLAMGLFLVTISLTYPLQSYPGITILIEVIKNHDTRFMPSEKCLKAIDYVAKPIFVLITFIIAHFVPFQAPFVAFVGNLCTTLLAVVFPSIMNLCLRYPKNYGKLYWILAKDLILVTVGLIWWLLGVFFSVHLIHIRLLSLKTANNREYL